MPLSRNPFAAAHQRQPKEELSRSHLLFRLIGHHLNVQEPAVAQEILESRRPHPSQPFDKQDGVLQVIVETPKGSRNKFAFDPVQRVFTLRKVLPAGMTFPYDFGFLPRTLAADGDPIDVLLLMDEPAFPGIAIRARLIGVIEGEQTDGKKTNRNDRLVAVAEANHEYANIRKLADLPGQFLHELEDFFVNYHKLEGKRFKLLGCKDTVAARRLIQKARKAA